LSQSDFSIPIHQIINEFRILRILYTTLKSKNQEEKKFFQKNRWQGLEKTEDRKREAKKRGRKDRMMNDE
jgi:hypothetical protein